MKDWSDFVVGKEYRKKDWDPKSFITCVGFSKSKLPIFENKIGSFHTPTSYLNGGLISSWEERKTPREFWAVNAYLCTSKDAAVSIKNTSFRESEILHLREVID